MVALSMADGFARLTGKPQCVIVHVDVGTQGLGAAVHNASCGRTPVLIFAGLSPYTIEGEARGSRTEYIHWIQDVPDQRQIISQYCRYSAEIKTGKNIKQIVNRALQFASQDPQGPVYLVGPREVMEQDLEPYQLDQTVWHTVGPSALSDEAIKQVAQHLVSAKEPLVITGYSGRKAKAMFELVKLADAIRGLRVLDTGGSDMCFPADHRASLGVRYGIHEDIKTADFILVIDCDVPWIPTQCKPMPNAKIVHIDVDVLKQQMPVFYIPAIARYRADAAASIRQIRTYLSSHEQYSKVLAGEDFSLRWDKLQETHQKRLQTISDEGSLPSNLESLFNTSIVTAAVRKACPPDTLWCIEAVTQTAFVADQLQPNLPNSWINCGGGGLGWSGGAALGIKLATDAQHGGLGKGKFVCQIVGDGTYLFSVPGSVYWISERYKIPVLTIVLNNHGWNAPKKSLLLVHPEGEGSKATNEELNISFRPTPDYAGIARAAGGGKIWAGQAGTVGELMDMLPKAINSVKDGTTAVLEAQLDGKEGKYNGGKAVLLG